MNDKLRIEILDNIMNLVSESNGKVSEESMRLTNAFFNCISQDIGDAIGEINDLTAPFIIASLEMYAKRIRESFPEATEIVDEIKTLPWMAIEKSNNEI